jgi:ribonuclease HII
MRQKLQAGVDEAGRGPLAGPVYAAAVILPEDHGVEGLADSKKLSAKQREALFDVICQTAIAWSIAYASVEEIDSINILQASLLAMKRAVEALKPQPHAIVVDGLFCPQVQMPAQAIVKGDSKVAAISAASILAKHARDTYILELCEEYPELARRYSLHQNMGYGTAAHLAGIAKYGITQWHRTTFGVCKVAPRCQMAAEDTEGVVEGVTEDSDGEAGV